MSLLTLLPNKGQEGSSRLTRNFGLFSTAPETRAASRRGTVTSLFQSLLIEGWGFKHMRRRASRDCWVQEAHALKFQRLAFLPDSFRTLTSHSAERRSRTPQFKIGSKRALRTFSLYCSCRIFSYRSLEFIWHSCAHSFESGTRRSFGGKTCADWRKLSAKLL